MTKLSTKRATRIPDAAGLVAVEDAVRVDDVPSMDLVLRYLHARHGAARSGAARNPHAATAMIARARLDRDGGPRLYLSDEVRVRGGAKSRRRTARVWKAR